MITQQDIDDFTADAAASNFCKNCGGQGIISTGIAEWSSTQCEKCNGTGLQTGEIIK